MQITVHADETCLRTLDLCDLVPADPTASPEAQISEVFDTAGRLLVAQGFSYADVVRTWIWLADIHRNYAALNRVRTRFLTRCGIPVDRLPASTGVGFRDAGAAMIRLSLRAVKPMVPAVRIVPVPSPLQNAAPRYGSWFSRAVEVTTPRSRTLYVSGTASLDHEGNTIHAGDLDGQVLHTLDVVEALLQSRNMDWRHVSQATAYLVDIGNQSRALRICQSVGLSPGTLTTRAADICRRDLLFELELEASQPFEPARP